jgi:hypothetical protein
MPKMQTFIVVKIKWKFTSSKPISPQVRASLSSLLLHLCWTTNLVLCYSINWFVLICFLSSSREVLAIIYLYMQTLKKLVVCIMNEKLLRITAAWVKSNMTISITHFPNYSILQACHIIFLLTAYINAATIFLQVALIIIYIYSEEKRLSLNC